MTERDLQAQAITRLERLVADTVKSIRDTAAQIEQESRQNIDSAAQKDRRFEWHTYPRVAGQLIHLIQKMVFNLKLDVLIDAADEAETARLAKEAPGFRDTLIQVVRGWAQPVGEQTFVLSDILRMIEDADRECGSSGGKGSSHPPAGGLSEDGDGR